MNIKTENIKAMPVITKTGKGFGFLVMATIWTKDGIAYDILFSKEENLITEHVGIKKLSHFFNKSFRPAKLDGMDCLISQDLAIKPIVNNNRKQ